MDETDDGDYVLHGDHLAEIEKKDKEVERLTKRDEVWKAKKELLETDLAKAWEEIGQLKDEVRESTESRDIWKGNWYMEAAAVRRGDEEIERLRSALRRIRDWPYDIMGDCVADAQREAGETLKEKTNET